MSAPVRLQLSRRKGFNLQAHSLATNGLPAVNCARPGKWGNPFPVDVYGRAGAVDRFRRWLEGQMSTQEMSEASRCDRRAHGFSLVMLHRDMLRGLSELRGKNLACWCRLCARHAERGKPLDEDCVDCAPCHCDPLGRAANRPICEEVKS